MTGLMAGLKAIIPPKIPDKSPCQFHSVDINKFCATGKNLFISHIDYIPTESKVIKAA